MTAAAALGLANTWMRFSCGAGGEAGLLSRRRFMNSVRMCRARAGLDPVFRVVMFVINGSCRSSVLAAGRVSPAGSAGGGAALCRWASAVAGPAVRLSGLR